MIKTKEKYCFTPVNQGNEDYRVAKVIENKSGYYAFGKVNPNDPHELDKFIGNYDYAKSICDAWNKRIGVSPKEEMRIVASSMEVQDD
jgi:hypothetical protein